MTVSMDIDCPKCGAKMQGPLLVRALCVERLKFSCRCGYMMTHPVRESVSRPSAPVETAPR